MVATPGGNPRVLTSTPFKPSLGGPDVAESGDASRQQPAPGANGSLPWGKAPTTSGAGATAASRAASGLAAALAAILLAAL